MSRSTVCFWCQGKLKLPYFKIVEDKDGNPLRVHKGCRAETELFFKPLTACLTDTGPGLRFDRSPKLAEEE